MPRPMKSRKKRLIRRRVRFSLFCVLLLLAIIETGKFALSYLLSDSLIQTEQTVGAGYLDIPLEGDSLNDINNEIDTSNSDYIKDLKQLAKSDNRINEIINQIDEYPDDLLELVIKNQETIEFVVNYPVKKDRSDKFKLTNEEENSDIPLFLQWDERWGYSNYSNNIMAVAGCGPTSLSMVVVGLTQNMLATPLEIAKFSESNGYSVAGSGTDWQLLSTGAKEYGLNVKELALWEPTMIKEIESGHPIICAMGPGDFTTTGHFIVIYGYEDGKFLVHDPNSIERSNTLWTFENIESQIRNMWAYSI
ncbi:MAG: C39 family peptidase [Turicibacter sp.]